MSHAQPSAHSDPQRRREIAAIHVAKKQLGLDDDAYRDVLFAATGKRSSAELDAGERKAVIERFREIGFKVGREGATFRRSEASPVSGATRRDNYVYHDKVEHRLVAALWKNLWLLGEVEDPGPRALDRFVERQAKVAALRFLAPEQLRAVVQALKAWLARAGFATPSHKAKDVKKLALTRLVKAQWARLAAIGAVKFENDMHRANALDAYFDRGFSPCKKGVDHPMTSAAELGAMAEKLGRWIRSARKRAPYGDASASPPESEESKPPE